MNAKADSSSSERLADRFGSLWEIGRPTPDVFTFLDSHPGLVPEKRLEILLVDQHFRWLRGQPLPLRVYLSVAPDIAARGDLVRALVDAERQERRRSAGRLNETVGTTSADLGSEFATQNLEVEPAR